MKPPLGRTKVVLRHLPHTITQSALVEQIDARFSGRYNWFCFRAGKNSTKHQLYSRAYINFKHPDDVIEFAEFFDGHVFVNEKGTQFKTIVEYAPSQRIPKQWSKKDGREGTIGKDPEYLEYLEFISKPVENLPSAEIQLEKKEAERAGAAKEAPIVTPLMDFVRQKRAAKGGPRRSLPNGKLMRTGASSSNSSSAGMKHGSEKKMTSTMYVLKDSGKNKNSKEKSTYVKRDDRQVSDKSGSVTPEEEKGASGAPDTGKKKILLLKGKEREIIHVVTDMPPQPNSSPVKPAYGSGTARQNQRHETSGRIIRSILVNKETRQNQSESNQSLNQEKDKRPPRALLLKDSNDDKGHVHDSHKDKRYRNNYKDKPDRGVWTPLRRSDGSDEALSSSASQSTQVLPDSVEGTCGEAKYDVSNELKPVGTGCGTHKHSGRRASTYNTKDADGSSNFSDGKPSKRGVSTGYGSHEKRIWVQKPSSGS
ncbi:regulator of nonsense transcripts UPF3-like [Bidens hawaiensis]|uniref:regulator of nonsense transcripts UPF3-like n=1 Tax=Bidens hawaiensis TaxID=980011 RepID=UPI00404A0D4B